MLSLRVCTFMDLSEWSLTHMKRDGQSSQPRTLGSSLGSGVVVKYFFLDKDGLCLDSKRDKKF